MTEGTFSGFYDGLGRLHGGDEARSFLLYTFTLAPASGCCSVVLISGPSKRERVKEIKETQIRQFANATEQRLE